MSLKASPIAGVLLLMVAWSCKAPRSHVDSTHFVDGRFRNPTPVPSQGFWRVAKHVMFGRNGAWPDEMVEVPRAAPPTSLDAQEVAVTFVNHATVLVQMPGLNVLTDPVWSHRVGPWSWAGPPRAVEPGIPIDELPPIDVIVISHNHYDHLDMPTLRRLAETHHATVLVPLGDRSLVESAGFRRVLELDWWETVKLDSGGEIVFTPAQHNSGRWPWQQNQSLWGSYLLRRNGVSVFFGGDTAYEAHFTQIRERYGPVDVALLPIGAYLPRPMMKRYHMNPSEAVKAHRDLDARLSIGIHYGTFQLTGEDFDQPVRDLSEALGQSPSTTSSFLAIPEGQTAIYTPSVIRAPSVRSAGNPSPTATRLPTANHGS